MPKPKRKIRIAEENEESSTVLETFENAEENTNVEEESADDEIEE
ncbi:2049_t:CDS:2, partial [Entrophospora sp. SA101]